jgi:hypothetical protein
MISSSEYSRSKPSRARAGTKLSSRPNENASRRKASTRGSMSLPLLSGSSVSEPLAHARACRLDLVRCVAVRQEVALKRADGGHEADRLPGAGLEAGLVAEGARDQRRERLRDELLRHRWVRRAERVVEELALEKVEAVRRRTHDLVRVRLANLVAFAQVDDVETRTILRAHELFEPLGALTKLGAGAVHRKAALHAVRALAELRAKTTARLSPLARVVLQLHARGLVVEEVGDP